jgi:eukaryotic-like serine/threonine-protein kinase
MGEVFLARITGAAGFEKLCVIKTILPQLTADRDFVDRFRHEAKVLVRLNHSNIADIYDMGEVDGALFMALEYVPGVELSFIQERARAEGTQVPVEIAVHFAQRIADALGYVHRRTGDDGAPLGLVHRDISPQNVLVSYEGEVKVIDFGLAKSSAKSRKTQPATMLGKLGYMSPEQARAEAVDFRSDIYSCGVVAWELLAGRPFFSATTVGEMLAQMSAPPRRPLMPLRAEVTPSLDAVIQRALNPRPEDRYPKADEFSQALSEQLLRMKSVVGGERVGEFVRHLCPQEYDGQKQLLGELATIGPPVSISSAVTNPSMGAEIDLSKERSGRGSGAPPTELVGATVVRSSKKAPVYLLGSAAAALALGIGFWMFRGTPAPASAAPLASPPPPVATPTPPAPPTSPATSSETQKAAAAAPHKPLLPAHRPSIPPRPPQEEGKAKGTTVAAVAPATNKPGPTGKPATPAAEFKVRSEFIRVAQGQWRVTVLNDTPIKWANCDLELSTGHKYHLAALSPREWAVIPWAHFKTESGDPLFPPKSLKASCEEGTQTVNYPEPPPAAPPLSRRNRKETPGTLEGHAELGRVSGAAGADDWRILVYNEGDAPWNACKFELPDGKHTLANAVRPHWTFVYHLGAFRLGDAKEDSPPEFLTATCDEGKSVFSFLPSRKP